jgi:hypothetical protein
MKILTKKILNVNFISNNRNYEILYNATNSSCLANESRLLIENPFPYNVILRCKGKS